MKKTVQSALLLLVVLAVGTSLMATVDAQKQFVAAYPDAKAKLGNCKTCHTMAPKPTKEAPGVNAYGKDLQEKAYDKAKNTYDFKKVEGLDSDGDGVKNADEIKAGTNPGDKASK